MQDGVTMATQPTDTAKPRLRAHGDELTAIAQRAQAFTNASGTAIALSEGNADEIICRARSGAAAPEVGTALRVEGSFTGLCIQSGKELRCDDAETDTRVDLAAIRALGIRSMVVTPIRDENKVTGVLACFAPTAHAFTITHVAVLKTMADQISVLLQKERRAREEGTAPETARTPAPEIAVHPAPVAPATPPPVVIKPSTASSNGAAAASAPARSSFPVVSKVDPVPFLKKEEKKSEVRTSFGTLDSVGWEGKKAGANFKILAAVAVLVVAAGGTFAFLKMHKSGTSAAAKQTQEATSPTSTAQTQPQQTQQAPATSSTSPVAASGNTASAPADNSSSAATNHAARPSAPAVVENRQPDRSVQRNERPAPTPVTLSSGPSQIKANEGQSTDVAPALTVAAGSTSGSLSALARPVGAAPAAALAQSELEPLKLLKSVPPIYPAIAKVRRLSGQVIVEVTVGKDGKTHNPKFIGGQPVFRDAAFDAVKQWVFKPAKLNGQAIEQTTQIKVDFHP